MSRQYISEDELDRIKSARQARNNISEARQNERDDRNFGRNERLKEIKEDRKLIKAFRKNQRDNVKELTAFENQGTRNIKNTGIDVPLQVEERGIHNMTVYNPFSAPEKIERRLGYNGFSLGDTGRTLNRPSVLDLMPDREGQKNIWI